MERKDRGIQLAMAEYSALRDEIAHLKNCQVRLVEIGFLIIGAVGTVLGFRALPATAGTAVGHQEASMNFWVVLVIPTILPILGWLIIHKCRSAFRAIAWCRIIEGFATEAPAMKDLPYPGYETCYAQLRKCCWLVDRKSPCLIGFLKRRLLPLTETFKESTPINMGTDALTNVKHAGYIGSYYPVILIILMVFAFFGWLVFLVLANAAGCMSLTSWPGIWAIAISVILGAYLGFSSWYLMSHCMRELVEEPFSIQAHYEMFMTVLATGKLRRSTRTTRQGKRKSSNSDV